VLVIDSCANKKEYKAKISEVMLEKLKVNSLLIMNSSSLSLFSTGATTGFVIELGHGISTVVPVY
jgi:centractin